MATDDIAAVLRAAWPHARLTGQPVTIFGGQWAAMRRLSVSGTPAGVPGDLVLRVVPDPTMGAKEMAVQQAVAEAGIRTPAVRLTGPAGGEGEPYRPIAVDNVFGRDEVVLRDGPGDVFTAAPGTTDLAGGEADWALDLAGDALEPGCGYERWTKAMNAEPVVYGRPVVDGEYLVLQYWLYYVYKHWNDAHESDWEMIQLIFDTTSVAEVLEQSPALYACAQHEGAEYAFPDDAVELEGPRRPSRARCA